MIQEASRAFIRRDASFQICAVENGGKMKQLNYRFTVPEQKRVRMLISTDAKNEADDQFAIAHHLMTPKFDVRGIIPAHFETPFRNTGTSCQASLDEVRLVLKLMDLEGVCPVEKGADGPLKDETTPMDSPGARLIIQEALREDARPLYIACQGTLTDMASAILLEPEICRHATCIWIGGGAYPEGGHEFNQDVDIAAANVVLSSEMPLWQVPMNVYKQMSVSLAELQYKVAPCGEIGKYLFEQMADFNLQLANIPHWPHGEIWGLGDSPTIGVLMFESERKDVYETRPAPRVDPETSRYLPGNAPREIRVYQDANARLTLEDFFAKLAINYG